MIHAGLKRFNGIKTISRPWYAVSKKLHIFPVNVTDDNVTSKYGINIKNSQAEFLIDCEALINTIDGIRSFLGYSDYRIDVWLCSDATMSEFNTLWRGPKKKPVADEEDNKGPVLLEDDEKTPVQAKYGSKNADGRQIGRVRTTSVTSRRAKTPSASKPKKKIYLNSTDILSFPALDFSSPGVPIRTCPPSNGHIAMNSTKSVQSVDTLATEKHLGDVMISASYIHRQCLKDRKMDEDGYEFDFDDDEVGVFRAMSGYFTVQERIPLLLVHGCVHLLGYDHETDAEWDIMTHKEEEIIVALDMKPKHTTA